MDQNQINLFWKELVNDFELIVDIKAFIIGGNKAHKLFFYKKAP